MKKKADVITQINAQEIWKNENTSRIEEQCMSPFIDNVSNDIAEITGYTELEFIDKEYNIGDFRADLLYRDNITGDFVVIENQLGTTNHDHLGKCITYLANIQAKTVVWISEKFRPEHIKAIETLNEITNDEYNFYALELHFEKAGNEDPYYYFQKIVAPSSVSKQANNVRQISSERQEQFCALENLIEDIKQNIPSAHFNRNKTFHKIGHKNKIYLGLNISLKKDKIIFEINTNENEQKEYLKEIVEKLNKTNKYNFVFSKGVRNKSIDKWTYMPNWDNWRYKKDEIKEICINMFNTITDKNGK